MQRAFVSTVQVGGKNAMLVNPKKSARFVAVQAASTTESQQVTLADNKYERFAVADGEIENVRR